MTDLFFSAAVFLCLDQWSKRLVEVHVGDRPIEWRLGLRLTCVRSARPIYRHHLVPGFFALVWLAALGSVLVLYRSGHGFQSRAALVALGAAFGGAAGNLLDILRLRAVSDFIDFRWWPAFNLADALIIGGLIIAFSLP